MKKAIRAIALISVALQVGCAKISPEEKKIISHFEGRNSFVLMADIFDHGDANGIVCALGYYEKSLREMDMGGWHLTSSVGVSQGQIEKINSWLARNVERNGENKWKLLFLRDGKIDYIEISRRNIDLRLAANESRLCVPIGRAALKKKSGGVIFMDIKDN